MSSKGTMNAAENLLSSNPNAGGSAEEKTRSVSQVEFKGRRAVELTTTQGSGEKFSNLHEMKRGSGDSNSGANNQSFSEQTKTTGSIGQMWDQ